MREDYPRFQDRQSEILAVAPDTVERTREYCLGNDLPFPCLADPRRIVFELYRVQSRFLSLGQRPGLYIVDREGVIRYVHVGSQQWDIPSNELVLSRLDEVEGRS